tara:strand:+ start:2501 stop:2797 length:297 start_codon:yes stop_codon:yes gene_type:complete
LEDPRDAHPAAVSRFGGAKSANSEEEIVTKYRTRTYGAWLDSSAGLAREAAEFHAYQQKVGKGDLVEVQSKEGIKGWKPAGKFRIRREVGFNAERVDV